MKTRLLILTIAGTLAMTQGQNPPASAAAEGPGVSQGGSGETPQANPPGPRERDPQGRRFQAPAQQGQPGGPSERFAGDGSGPMPSPLPEMGPEGGGPGPAAGPGFGDGPEFAFEQGSDPDEMAGLEEPGMDSGEDLREGPAFGGAPGSVRGPGPFGPRPEGPDFGITAAPPGEALQAFLGLNDEQVRSLRRLQRERAGKLDEARLQLHRRQGALLDLLEQEEPDGNALVSTVKSIHALRKQAREIEKEFREKTAAVLNEDQQTRLKSIQDANQIPRAMREAARLDLIRPTEMVPGGYVPRQ